MAPLPWRAVDGGYFRAIDGTGMTTRGVLERLADGAFHTEAELAGFLALDALSLRERLAALEADGLPLRRDPARGVALPWPVELLDAGRICADLPDVVAGSMGTLDVRWEVDSTNNVLRRSPAAPDLSCLFAERQSAGRGRRGRRWLSPPGLNIQMSVCKDFRAGVAALGGLSLAVGVMLLRALAAVGVAGDMGLKWPNDVLARGAKLAGILIELDAVRDAGCRAVVGVGVNLRLPVAVRAAAGQETIDVAELLGGVSLSRNDFAACLLRELVCGLDCFATEGFAAFAADFARSDLLRGRLLQVTGAEGVFEGIGDGIDERGALRVRTPRGVRELDSGEVSVRVA